MNDDAKDRKWPLNDPDDQRQVTEGTLVCDDHDATIKIAWPCSSCQKLYFIPWDQDSNRKVCCRACKKYEPSGDGHDSREAEFLVEPERRLAVVLNAIVDRIDKVTDLHADVADLVVELSAEVESLATRVTALERARTAPVQNEAETEEEEVVLMLKDIMGACGFRPGTSYSEAALRRELSDDDFRLLAHHGLMVRDGEDVDEESGRLSPYWTFVEDACS